MLIYSIPTFDPSISEFCSTSIAVFTQNVEKHVCCCIIYFMKDKNRKLSEQEENRAAVFDTLASHLQEEGYQRKDLTISIKDANIKGMIAVAPDVIVWILLYIVFNTGKPMNTPMILLVPLMIVGIVVHELLHGLVWGLCCEEHFRSISFGFIWKMLTPYCTCSQPLKQSYYIAGSIAPYLLLGILPCAIGVISSACIPVWYYHGNGCSRRYPDHTHDQKRWKNRCSISGSSI